MDTIAEASQPLLPFATWFVTPCRLAGPDYQTIDLLGSLSLFLRQIKKIQARTIWSLIIEEKIVTFCSCISMLQVLVRHGLFLIAPHSPQMALSTQMLDFIQTLLQCSQCFHGCSLHLLREEGISFPEPAGMSITTSSC